jgi:hypothetical protein
MWTKECKEGWRIRSNKESQNWIRGQDTDKYMKHNRAKWRGHLNKMEDMKLVKKITDWNPMGIRTEGPPRKSW